MKVKIPSYSGQDPNPSLGIDIDPNDAAGSAPELQDPAGYQQPESPVHEAPALPTVLKKLQKWGDYASFGDVVEPTKLIPMKTPLSNEILASWSLPEAPRHRLTVADLLTEQEQLGRKVGLILDLSNHDCLYTDDIPPHVAYNHIHLVAKELPPRTFVSEVCAALNQWWAEHPNDYVAMHCAYGFNRTGFVVCCYLIEHRGLTVEEALDAFAKSRPPGVKHETFRNELHARYASRSSRTQHQLGVSVVVTPQEGCSEGVKLHVEVRKPQGAGVAVTAAVVGVAATAAPSAAADQAKVEGHEEFAAAGCSSPGEAANAASNVQRMGQLAATVQRGGPGAAAAADSMLRMGGNMLMDSPQGAALYGTGGNNGENDSLGANDRCIIAGLRAHQAALLPQPAPTEASNNVGEGTSLGSMKLSGFPPSPVNPKLQRTSLSDIQWGDAAPVAPQSGGAKPGISKSMKDKFKL